MITYKQCKLTKDNTSKFIWIPSQFAKKNKIVKLKSTYGWDDGWKVEEVFGKELDEKIIQTLSDAWRYQRDVSDI